MLYFLMLYDFEFVVLLRTEKVICPVVFLWFCLIRTNSVGYLHFMLKMMMSSSHGQSSASSPYGGSCSPPGVSHHPIHQNDYQTTIQHSTNELPTGSEFRDRVQTAPTILRRQRKTTMIENNNTEGNLLLDIANFWDFFMLFGFC